MSLEKTLSIIKPDGVERNLIGSILSEFEHHGLKICAIRYKLLSTSEAQEFYSVHKHRPFYEELVEYMTRSAVVISVLEGENAVTRHRQVMGATNPAEAEEGTIRKKYALSIQENTVHGSDSLDNAQKEIQFFFAQSELISQ